MVSKVLRASNTKNPGTKVRQLQSKLENKDKENEALKSAILDLINASNSLNKWPRF